MRRGDGGGDRGVGIVGDVGLRRGGRLGRQLITCFSGGMLHRMACPSCGTNRDLSEPNKEKGEERKGKERHIQLLSCSLAVASCAPRAILAVATKVKKMYIAANAGIVR